MLTCESAVVSWWIKVAQLAVPLLGVGVASCGNDDPDIRNYDDMYPANCESASATCELTAPSNGNFEFGFGSRLDMAMVPPTSEVELFGTDGGCETELDITGKASAD
jgi:hypothetical protein